jgi:hypothetical protein
MTAEILNATALDILMSIKDADCDRWLDYEPRLSSEGRGTLISNCLDLGHQKFGGLFLSSGDLIRCNSIRKTVQAQHKHIPRERDGHHSCDSEP